MAPHQPLPQNSLPARDSLRVPELIAILWRRKWWLGGCLIFTVGLGIAYLLNTAPVYQVNARILVEQKGLTPSQERPERDKDFLATQAEIIRSPAVVARAVDRLGLKAASPDERSPVVSILESLSVNPLLGTNVLSVSLQAPDATRATRTVETVIESYQEYVRDSERGAHLDTLRTLTASEKKVRGDLRELEAEYAQLRQTSPLIGRDADRASVQRDLLTHLGQRLADAKSRRMELENRLVTLQGLHEESIAAADALRVVSADGPHLVHTNAKTGESPKQESLPNVARGAEYALLQHAAGEQGVVEEIRHIQEQLADAQAREKELTQTYGPKHADIRAVREQISNWESLLRERCASAPLVLQQQLEATQMHEQQLTELYQEEFQKAKEVDDFLLKEQQAMAHIQRTQEVHGSILSQVRQWQLVDQALAQGEAGIGVRVLEQPSVSERQVWPPKFLVLGACALVGLMGGMGLVITAGSPGGEVFGDRAMRSDATAFSRIADAAPASLSILARIPAMSVPEGSLTASRVVLERPDSSAAAGFRRLGARLLGLRPVHSSSGQSVSITGVVDGAGATTMVTNLALSLAQQGRKVAVVDTDLRTGDLAERLGVVVSPGLDAVLRGEVALEDALQPSPLAPVDVLGRGTSAPDSIPSACGEAGFRKILESLRSHYDLVLIDTPGVSLSSDPLGVAKTVDGVVLVLGEEPPASAAADQCRQRFGAAGATLLGAVLNRIESTATEAPAQEALRE